MCGSPLSLLPVLVPGPRGLLSQSLGLAPGLGFEPDLQVACASHGEKLVRCGGRSHGFCVRRDQEGRLHPRCPGTKGVSFTPEALSSGERPVRTHT